MKIQLLLLMAYFIALPSHANDAPELACAPIKERIRQNIEFFHKSIVNNKETTEDIKENLKKYFKERYESRKVDLTKILARNLDSSIMENIGSYLNTPQNLNEWTHYDIEDFIDSLDIYSFLSTNNLFLASNLFSTVNFNQHSNSPHEFIWSKVKTDAFLYTSGVLLFDTVANTYHRSLLLKRGMIMVNPDRAYMQPLYKFVKAFKKAYSHLNPREFRKVREPFKTFLASFERLIENIIKGNEWSQSEISHYLQSAFKTSKVKNALSKANLRTLDNVVFEDAVTEVTNKYLKFADEVYDGVDDWGMRIPRSSSSPALKFLKRIGMGLSIVDLLFIDCNDRFQNAQKFEDLFEKQISSFLFGVYDEHSFLDSFSCSELFTSTDPQNTSYDEDRIHIGGMNDVFNSLFGPSVITQTLVGCFDSSYCHKNRVGFLSQAIIEVLHSAGKRF